MSPVLLLILGIVIIVIVWKWHGQGNKTVPAPAPAPSEAPEGVFVFRYHNLKFERIPDPPYQIMAEEFRDNCIQALEPLREEIERLNGQVIVNITDYCNGAELRIRNLTPDLEQRIAQVVGGVSKPLPPLGTYDYVKRQVKAAKRRAK
jgi:hypothetical protein